MKKQLSFALLTLSIFSINILPGQASTMIIRSSTESVVLQDEQATIKDDDKGNKWCAELPWMGLLCWGL